MRSGDGMLQTAEVTAALAQRTRPHAWLRVGRGFDGEAVRADLHVVYEGATLLHVGGPPPLGVLRAGQTEPDLHLPRHTILPGLIEAHSHLFLAGGELHPDRRAENLKLSEADLLARAEARLERLVRLGFAAVRDAGDRNQVGLALQRRYQSPARGPMPAVESPGAAIHHQGRYGSFMARALQEHGGIAAAVDARVAEGARHIKLLATGVINFEKGTVTAKPQMPADELREAVAAARKHGRQVMVHCSGHDGVANCLAGGVDTIEHGFFVDRAQLAQMRDLDVAWVPTFAPVQFQKDHGRELGWSDLVCTNLQRILDDHAASLVHAAEIGVRIVAGSDAGSHGVAHGHGFLWELELMERAGLSAARVLHTATGAAAARLDLGEPVGRLKAGARARFILTEAPVLESVRHLRAPCTVVHDGEAVDGGDDPQRPGL